MLKIIVVLIIINLIVDLIFKIKESKTKTNCLDNINHLIERNLIYKGEEMCSYKYIINLIEEDYKRIKSDLDKEVIE